MRTSSRLTFVVSIGLALLSIASARERWITARTEHFEMFSCASESESREMLNKLEQFRATVLATYSLPRFRDPRTTIMLFGTDRQFEPYKPLYNGKPNDVAGYCTGGPDESMIAMTADNDSEFTDEVIFHEYVHVLLAAGGEQPPPWLDEGLAEFFSTFKVWENSFELGRAKPDHVETLRQHAFLPLGRLFAVTHRSPEYNEGDRRDVFYAESWALVHFMICGKDRAIYLPRLRRFNELIAAPDSAIDRSFREAFGVDYDEMETRLRDAMKGGGYRIATGPLIVGDLSAKIKFQPAGDFERDVALISLRWRLQTPGDTAYRLMQLAETHPTAPRPHEVLAAVAVRGQDPEGALSHWRRAAELGSDNPYVYMRLASDRLDQVTAGLTLDYRMPAELAATLRGWLDRAVALSPRYFEAFEALAMVEAFAEKPRLEVINRVQGMVPKMSDKTRTLFAIAIVHWRKGDFVTARQIAKLLVAAPTISPRLRSLTQRLSKELPPTKTPYAPAAEGPP